MSQPGLQAIPWAARCNSAVVTFWPARSTSLLPFLACGILAVHGLLGLASNINKDTGFEQLTKILASTPASKLWMHLLIIRAPPATLTPLSLCHMTFSYLILQFVPCGEELQRVPPHGPLFLFFCGFLLFF